MRDIPFGENAAAQVTVMREDAATGISVELQDGNMLPRLCEYAGAGACAQGCQVELLATRLTPDSKDCAQQNILSSLGEIQVNPENFAMVAATKDRVGFADELEALGATTHPDRYTLVPDCNAFFFRPGVDKTEGGYRNLTNVAMRMADCGDVVYSFKDADRQDVLGIAHFSRSNMRGPSAYEHEINGRKVSWGEYVLTMAVEHYGADPSSVQIKLVAAVEGRNFIHSYKDLEAMRQHYPGWEELGLMHPQGETNFDCLIDYREMIAWQLLESIQNPAIQLTADQLEMSDVIDTGNLRLGHASHHAASKGIIPHGRDMYIIGLDQRSYLAARVQELAELQTARAYAINTMRGDMDDEDYFAAQRILEDGAAELQRVNAALTELL